MLIQTRSYEAPDLPEDDRAGEKDSGNKGEF